MPHDANISVDLQFSADEDNLLSIVWDYLRSQVNLDQIVRPGGTDLESSQSYNLSFNPGTNLAVKVSSNEDGNGIITTLRKSIYRAPTDWKCPNVCVLAGCS